MGVIRSKPRRRWLTPKECVEALKVDGYARSLDNVYEVSQEPKNGIETAKRIPKGKKRRVLHIRYVDLLRHYKGQGTPKAGAMDAREIALHFGVARNVVYQWADRARKKGDWPGYNAAWLAMLEKAHAVQAVPGDSPAMSVAERKAQLVIRDLERRDAVAEGKYCNREEVVAVAGELGELIRRYAENLDLSTRAAHARDLRDAGIPAKYLDKALANMAKSERDRGVSLVGMVRAHLDKMTTPAKE